MSVHPYQAAQEFDVIVVGAGPAGATTACYLARESRQGDSPLSVALLDRARFPRDKYCGDAWCAPALDILEDLGILQPLVTEGLVQDTTSGGFVSPSGENYMTSTEGEATVSKENRTFAIRRLICDERIARRAAEVGANLIEEASVEEATLEADGKWCIRCADGRTFRSRMLIAADGATSRLARSLGVVSTAPSAVAARQYVQGGTHNFKAGGVLLFPEYILPGYVALFRHYNDDIDLGAYIIPGGAARVEDAARIYEDKVYNDPFIQRVLGPRVQFLEPVRTASLRMGGEPCSTTRQFLAVGDAAGQTDPLTGEGIHTAMIGGRLAARRVLEMFAENRFDEDATAVYHQRWMTAFGKDFSSSALSARMSYRFPFFLDAAATLAERTEGRFMDEFGAIMTGVKPKSTYARPDIALPLTLEVGKHFFRQKILRQPAGEAAYHRRAGENDARPSSFSTVCLRDNTLPPAPIFSDQAMQKDGTALFEALFRFATPAGPSLPILILYGSEYGFCKQAALRLAEQLRALPLEDGTLAPRVLDLSAHSLVDWSKEPLALFLCATTGDGEFPENARSFVEWLEGKGRLDNLKLSVLACGDSAYPDFCQAGHDLQALLEQAGAVPLLPLHEVDQENEDQLDGWFEAVQTLLLRQEWHCPDGEDYLYALAQAHYTGQDGPSRISRQHPCRARLLSRRRLTNDPGGEQETVSLELSLYGEGETRRMDWQAGDALGVLAQNDPVLVARLLHLMRQPAHTPFSLSSERLALGDALTQHLDIQPLNRARVEAFIAHLVDEEKAHWQEHVRFIGNEKAALQDYAQGRELIDLLEDFPKTTASLSPQCWHAWLQLLAPIQPRYYSIASSPLTSTEQLTLCISRVRYTVQGRARAGLASNHLAARLDTGETLEVFLQPNRKFRPTPLNAPVGSVMIGPGTGVAPFRAFMQHWAHQAVAQGKTLAEIWPNGDVPLLFFGCRHPDKDFLYREEWEAMAAAGELRLFTAFSRQQTEKIYVQHRLREQAALIWQRLERGAQIFLCGDATHMAHDVETALLEVIAEQGRLNVEAARAYLNHLGRTGRYQKDVWT